MNAAGGSPPYLWSATGLPAGLTMSMAGELSWNADDGRHLVGRRVLERQPRRLRDAVVLDHGRSGPRPPRRPGALHHPPGWRGEYYANTTLTGVPALCRDDADIDFCWNGASPGAGVPGTDFSVRWTSTAQFAAGSYEFVMGSDDGARLYIDGTLVIDDWVPRPHTTRAITQVMTPGPHTIVMEYFQSPGQSSATLDWTAIVPAVCPTTVTGWLGEYFHNRTLTGPPLVVSRRHGRRLQLGAGHAGRTDPDR